MHQSISKWISFQINRPNQSISGNMLRTICSLFCLIEDLVAVCRLKFLDFYSFKMCLHCRGFNHLIDHGAVWFHANVHNASFSSSPVEPMLIWLNIFLCTVQIANNSWSSLIHYHYFSFKNCFFPYRLLKRACWPHMYSSPTHTAVSQATGRAPSPASSCKPQTDWSIPLEGDFAQSGHHQHGRWRGKILRKTGITAHQ